MSVAAATNKEDRKPQYKDYVNFLGSYKQERNDEHDKEVGCSFISRNESNEMPKNTFKDYLGQYNNKKFTPVQAEIKNNSNSSEESKIVRTEVFIEINNGQKSDSKISKTIDLNITSGKDSEKKLMAKQYTKNNNSVYHAESNNEQCEQRRITVSEVSQNFEKKISTSKRHPLKKTPSITEKSRIFETHIKKNKTNSQIVPEIKKIEMSQGLKQNSLPPSPKNGTLPPKPVLNISKMQDKKVPVIPKTVEICSIPPPPPPPAVQIQHINIGSESIVPSLTSTIPSNTAAEDTSPSGIPPPPPPLPPADFTPQKAKTQNAKVQSNVYNTLPRTHSTRPLDSTDGEAVPALDKNDPRVKKMVYGALRGMYGAYHDKANDYLATLPKNRVRKNNGLDSIINSIASQGGLGKLNGRVNPKVEAE
ncbi:hypothetical protein JTB14_024839 [Gonioctena quinquepunctata]|nr:hypothetical protein JTB14_024839 [Gonioctena quinquepunctata]